MRRYKVARPQNPVGVAEPIMVEFAPIAGLNVSAPPSRLQPGETPYSQNFSRRGDQIEVRSGLSNFGDAGLGGSQPIMAVVASRASDFAYAVVASANQISYIRTDSFGTVWRQLGGAVSSTNTRAFYSAVAVYNATDFEKNLIMTNGVDLPKRWIMSQNTVSLLSSFASVESFARYVTTFDDRALFFYCGQSDTSIFANRLRWSKRGDPSNYTDVDAGFEDIANMKGFGTGIVAERDRLLLFTNEEIWMARHRGDAYLFDFIPISTALGCPFPRTIMNSAHDGTFFVAPDYQVHRVVGNEVRSVSDHIDNFIEADLVGDDLMWSKYNERTNTYEVYYTSAAADFPAESYPELSSNLLKMDTVDTDQRFTLTGGLLTLNTDEPTGAHRSGVLNGYLVLYSEEDWPSRGLWLDVDHLVPAAGSPTIDRGPWLMQDMDDLRLAVGANDMVVSSMGTPYRFSRAQLTDDGTQIDARWRTAAIHGSKDWSQFEVPTYMWLDYHGESASTLSLYYSLDMGASFHTAGAASLSSGGRTAQVPFTASAARHTMLELRHVGEARPKISHVRLALRAYSGRFVP